MTKKVLGVLLPDWIEEGVLKGLVYSFLGLAAAILVSILFVWPRFSDLYREEKELKRLEKSLSGLLRSVDSVQKFEVDLGEEELLPLSLAVPKVFDPGLILSSLRQVSNSAGVIIESYELDKGTLEVETDEKIDNLKKHKVKLKLVGDSGRLVRFIDLLNNSLPISVISDLSLSEVSKLFSLQGLSQLEMELTYFEMGIPKASLEKLAEFRDEDRQLLNEIVLYVRPETSLMDNTGVWVERRESVFGF